jgi:hypothetical protein
LSETELGLLLLGQNLNGQWKTKQIPILVLLFFLLHGIAMMLPFRFPTRRVMTAQHAETQTPNTSNCTEGHSKAQLNAVDKNWFRAKLQPYSQQIVFFWNSVLLLDDVVLSSALFSIIVAFFG